jgi:hypothetical protein
MIRDLRDNEIIKKIDYKNGVYYFNDENLGNFRDNDELHEYFLNGLDRVKNIKNDYKKALSLSTHMFLTLGKCITRSYFNKVLDYVELDYEFFIKYVERCYVQNIKCVCCSLWWFDTIDMDTFQEATNYVDKKFKEPRTTEENEFPRYKICK